MIESTPPSTTASSVTGTKPAGKDNQQFVRELAITLSLMRAADRVLQALKKTRHLFHRS